MKKLIEVSLPLEAINREAAREKSIRHGHPSTLHLWWARRPLAACRAVLFSSLVDDPSEYMPDEASAHAERERLFEIIEDLVKWENSNNEEVLDRAKLEIARSVARNLGVDVPVGKEAIREFLATKAPPVLDPFAGGGSIPLEAQRLGLRAYASDLNPVAVLINKALIEIPPKFAGLPPVHPPEEEQVSKKKGRKGEGTIPLFAREWKGAQGLAEDVRYYGKWMRDEAFKRIGHLYPPVTITQELLKDRVDLKEQGYKAGDQLTVIAWLWARTVKCPNPACGAQMPLIRSFAVSKKVGKQIWLEPKINTTLSVPVISYKISSGNLPKVSGTIDRNGAFCLACKTPVGFDYIRGEGQGKRIQSQLIGIIADGKRGRIYLPALDQHQAVAESVSADWVPDTNLPEKALGFRVQLYGMTKHSDLFTNRQILALRTFTAMIKDLVIKILQDSRSWSGTVENTSYANAIAVYLALAISKNSHYWCSLSTWHAGRETIQGLFARQAVPMVWDFAECNPFSDSGGNLAGAFEWNAKVLDDLASGKSANIQQSDARIIHLPSRDTVISTDPPYYDNIGYADLSDFFYIWLRLCLAEIVPDLFKMVLVPKQNELIAAPYRFQEDKTEADEYFEKGLAAVFNNIAEQVDGVYPTTIFYAFKQSENVTDSDDEDDAHIQEGSRTSTGWETFLQGLIGAGWQIDGTWPMRTESSGRTRARTSNALASSIILVCRPRSGDLSSSRREFLSVLKKELASALRELQQGSIAPVDLAQAAVGPGMAIFSRYSAVLEADGKPMSVRTALGLINQALDEYLSEQEGEYDGDTRWALSWYEQFGHNEAAFGVAETLSKAKNTSVGGLEEAGILEARAGKVRLYRRDELDTEWDPSTDKRLTAWEACQHLIYALENGGEESAAGLLAKLGSIAEPARDLAYRLYTVCERKGWAQDALGYNMLVVAWPRLKELSTRKAEPNQGKLM